MEYIFMQKELPEVRKKRLSLLNNIVLAANYIDIIVYYAILCYSNYLAVPVDKAIFDEKGWFWSYIIARYAVGGLQLLSGIFLLISVFVIRSFLVEQGLKDQVNHQAMIIHSVSFSLYNLAIVVYYAFYFNYELQLTASSFKSALYAWTVTTYTNFFAQLCLIWIFLQFRTKKERDTNAINLDDVKCSVVRIEEFEDMLPKNDAISKDTSSLLGNEPEIQKVEED